MKDRQQRKLVKEVKKLLRHIAKAFRAKGDKWEVMMDEARARIAELPREGILSAIDEASADSKSLEKAALHMLFELADVPEVTRRVEQRLGDPDPEVRRTMIDAIGYKQVHELAPLLNSIILNDPDEDCRRIAIAEAGRMAQNVNFPVILQLARQGLPESPWLMTRVLKNYGRPEGRFYLEDRFHSAPEKQERVIAAWGLGKLGDKEAIAYLGNVLYDPEKHGRKLSYGHWVTYWDPGEALGAAQALVDLFNLAETLNLPARYNAVHLPFIQQWWEENKERILDNA